MQARTLLAAALLTGSAAWAETGLLDAIRNDDAPAVQQLIHFGADLNGRNEVGATALMYAAAFASPDYVRLLLDAGADVNVASNGGATALMWATGNTAKVRLLLEHGAQVNAKAKDGTTALVTAGLRGNVDAMRLLIARGADAKVSPGELLHSAWSRKNPDMRQLLAEAGVDLKGTKLIADALRAGDGVSAGLVRKLVDGGADPNETHVQVTVKFPVFSLATHLRSAETVRTLIDRGADPNLPDTRKRTALMMAAAQNDPRLVGLLITKSTDVNACDEAGRTALDWALTRGETAAVRLLRAAGGKSLAPRAAAPPPVRESRTARSAMEAALGQLLPASVTSWESWQCVTCHHQSLPSIAAKLARDHGVAVHGPVGGEDNTTAGRSLEDLMFGRGFGNGYPMLALAERGAPAAFSTDAIVHHIAEGQMTDGSWPSTDPRPPLDGGTILPTALAIRALSVYAPPVTREEAAGRITRARAYLLAAAPGETQDEAFKLLGLVWSRASETEISRQKDRVLQLQRDDGGWGQFPEIPSDAYATGEALYALHLSGVHANTKAYRRGADHLLRTQLEDGTWFVRSRAFGFQPYTETGFPHGVDQFISAAATSWAVIALAYTL